jgi:hypothetical protein
MVGEDEDEGGVVSGYCCKNKYTVKWFCLSGVATASTIYIVLPSIRISSFHNMISNTCIIRYIELNIWSL